MEWVRGWGGARSLQPRKLFLRGRGLGQRSLDFECRFVHSSFCLRIITYLVEEIRATGPPEPVPGPRQHGW